MKKPKTAQYVYKGDYYKRGASHYAYYFSKGTWRESASVTNNELTEFGEEIESDELQRLSKNS